MPLSLILPVGFRGSLSGSGGGTVEEPHEFTDTDAAAYAVAGPGRPTAWQRALDEMVIALKAQDIWDDLQGFQLYDQWSLGKNLKNPATYVATAVNSPTFGPYGVTGNGTTSYVDTGYNTGVSPGLFVQNNCHMGVYVGTNVEATTTTQWDCGHDRAAINTRIATDDVIVRCSTSTASQVNAAAVASDIDGFSSIGWTCISRDNSANFVLTRNDQFDAVQTVASISAASLPFFVCARATTGPVATAHSTRRNQCFHWGMALTAGKRIAMWDIINAYMGVLAEEELKAANSAWFTASPGVTYEAEAQALFDEIATYNIVLTRGERYAYNRWYQRMKAANLLTKVQAAWMPTRIYGLGYLVNLITPGSRDLTIVARPTSTRYAGVRGSATGYYDTGFAANLLDPDNCHMALMSETVSTDANAAAGSLNVGSEGFSISPYTGAIRLASAEVTASVAGTANGAGFILASRDNSSTIRVERNGQELQSALAAANTAIPTGNIYIGKVNANGTPGTVSDKLVSFVSVGTAMTHAESELYYAITRTLWETIRYGTPEIHDASSAPTAVSADFIAYGTTPGAIAAAYEAKRQGLNAIIVGGWRDRHLGGMMAGGIGALDWFVFAQMGGLADWFTLEYQFASGYVDGTRKVEPKYSEGIFRQMLDPRRRDGRHVPVYYSDGVDTVTKAGARISQITTVDGRTFSASYFLDGSYEGDLLARSGVRYRIGREDVTTGATGQEASLGGYRQIDSPSFVVDPYVTPGVSASGNIWPVNPISARAAGNGDVAEYIDGVEVSSSGIPPQTQAYNFRVPMTEDPARRAAFPAAPPTFDMTKLEIVFRSWASRVAAGQTILFVQLGGNSVAADQGTLSADGTRDINSTSGSQGISSEIAGENWTYPEASYSARETIRTLHRDFMRALFWQSQYGTDPRIPASIPADAATWGYLNDHYLDPHPNDPLHFPFQFYVRESRRPIGDIVVNGADLEKANGTAGWAHPIGTASYSTDSHTMQFMIRNNAGTHKIVSEGFFFNATGCGANQFSPIPYEMIVPKKAECENLGFSFCVSCTKVAMSAIRMESSSMQMGQAYGIAAAIAFESSGLAVQDVPYATLAARLTASPRNYKHGASATDVLEKAPVMPTTF